LNTTFEFFSELFKEKPNFPQLAKKFLKGITPIEDLQNSEDLTKPITKTELFWIIKQMATGKTPGPDGIAIEFYRKCWHIIGDDFTQVLNEMHEKGIIPDEIKSGIITFVHKKNKKEDLRNYRPISLLNTDLKIYTKILANRLKPLLQKILQSYQFAAPGKTITDATTLLRDLHDYVPSRNLNAFFISLEFENAFDSVNHEWLYTVLKKMNFSNSFLKIVESLYTNATSKLLINGHLTKSIKMEKGIRQGDPSSLFLFLLATNPLVTQIQNDSTIQGIRIPGRRIVKNVSYADDITITITGKQAVYATFNTLTEFSKASGLKLNLSKTQGLYFQPNTVLQNLPQISWNKEALNTVY